MYYYEFQSPLGAITLISQGQHLIRTEYGRLEDKRQKITQWLEKYDLSADLEMSEQPFKQVIKQLDDYFQQKRTTFTIPYRFYGTSFQQKVWEALATKVPYGSTCSYQDIARYTGSPKAVRAVGGANNKNPISIIVPCHRVIGKNGKLIGYGGGLDKKEYLLALEKNNL